MSRVSKFVLLVFIMAFGAVGFAGEHDHHEHGKSTLKLSLNKGKKWQTDKALRENMEEIHSHIKGILPKLKDKTASSKEYKKLGQAAGNNVNNIFKTCKLPAKADAQLHIVLAEILAAKQVLVDDSSIDKKREAVDKVIAGYKSYIKYFDVEGKN